MKTGLLPTLGFILLAQTGFAVAQDFSGASLSFGGTGSYTGSVAVYSGGTGTLILGSTLANGSATSSLGSVVTVGSGTSSLGGILTVNSGSTISGGTLTVNSGTTVSGGTLTINSGISSLGTLTLTSGITLYNSNLNIVNGATIPFTIPDSDLLLSGVTLPTFIDTNQPVSFTTVGSSPGFEDLGASGSGNVVALAHASTPPTSFPFDSQSVPEPSTWALLFGSLAGLVLFRRSTRKSH